MLLLRMAFRNILRNKRRSFLTCTVIGLGLAFMVIMDGFIDGMSKNMISSITNGIASEGQIHHPEFLDSKRSKYSIKKLKEVRDILNSDKNVEAYSERVIVPAMISSTANMKNIVVFGVDPEDEKQVTNIYKYITAGEFVKNEKSLVIGYELKKKLEVELGDRIIVSTANIDSEEISQELYRLSGVLRYGSLDVDESLVFIHKKLAQKISGLGENIHEIALKFDNKNIVEDVNNKFWTKFDNLGNEAKSWKDLFASFVKVMQTTDISKAVIALILMLIVGLGIVNTLFMALYERIFEFAVMRSLGTKSVQIIYLIFLEGLFLGILGALLGFVFSGLLTIPFTYIGVDYGGLEFADVTIKDPIYYIFSWAHYTLYPFITVLFTALISIYPAIHMSRISLSESLKRSS